MRRWGEARDYEFWGQDMMEISVQQIKAEKKTGKCDVYGKYNHDDRVSETNSVD